MLFSNILSIRRICVLYTHLVKLKLIDFWSWNKSICKLNVITKSSSKMGILEWVGGQQGQWTEKHGLAGRLPWSLCCRKFIQHRQIQRLPQSVSVPDSLQIPMNWANRNIVSFSSILCRRFISIQNLIILEKPAKSRVSPFLDHKKPSSLLTSPPPHNFLCLVQGAQMTNFIYTRLALLPPPGGVNKNL